MRCPVSMLPTSGNSTGSILFVIGILAVISYSLQAKNKAKTTSNQAVPK